MFHEQHAHAFRLQPPQQVGELLLLLVTQPGGRLVESSSVGSQHSARAISRIRCWPSARLPASSYMCFQADAADLLRSLGQQLRFLGIEPHDAAPHARMAAQVRTDRDVLEHRHRRQQLHVLERPADAAADDLARCEPVDALATERDRAAHRLQHARHEVEGGRLAGAVRADQPDDLPA